MKTIIRRSSLSPEVFEDEHLRPGVPVVVTDAMVGWSLGERWTPDWLHKRFGGYRVQVYNSYFDFQTVQRLSAFLSARFGRKDAGTELPYVRWYTRFKDVDFCWADAFFQEVRDEWEFPYFLPNQGYLLPRRTGPEAQDLRTQPFPAKGLFISGSGARTGLHVDPWASDAVLCQAYGAKHWLMFAPELADRLMAGADVMDLERPDYGKFPLAAGLEPTCEFTLLPGEMVYVPRGWLHAVRSLDDSISVTWNFVHCAGATAFEHWLDGEISSLDEDVLRFFYGGVASGDFMPSDAGLASKLRGRLLR